MASRKNEAIWIESRMRWQINVQFNGQRKTFCSTIPGKKGKAEAERRADRWLAEGAHSGNQRLATVWQAWLSKQEELNGPLNPTLKRNEQVGRLYILPHIGNRRVSSLTPQDWQDCINRAYIQRKLAKKTLCNIRGSITSFARFCRLNRIDMERPEDLTIPRDAQEGERTILQPNDIRTLLTQDSIQHYGKPCRCHYINAWRLIVLTGLRPGEALGIQESDIKGNVLTIRRAINVDGQITRGKNQNARSSILLDERSLRVISEQLAYKRQMGLCSAWLFPSMDDAQGDERKMYKAWLIYRRQHGLAAASLYELRHTMVSVAAAVPDALLKLQVRHSQSMDTRGTYGHEMDGQKAAAAALISAAFDEILTNE